MLTEFGAELDGWDLDGTGCVGVGLFASALSVYVALRDDPVTVEAAAAAFNATPAIIREAVDWHYWMYLAGDVIQHDGE